MEDADIPDLRRAVRAHLAERPSVSQSAETIHRHLAREFRATLEDVANALSFLAALGQLRPSHDPMGGATLFYQATADGILAHERGQ